LIIIDTSIWIEFFKGRNPYFDQVSNLLTTNDILALSPIFGELLQGAKSNNERSIIIEFWNNLPKISESDLFIHAGFISGKQKWLDKGVGLIDSVIIIASQETSSFIWTLDTKLSRLLKKEELYTPS
jgi:predicted nucleic acid-binding protein